MRRNQSLSVQLWRGRTAVQPLATPCLPHNGIVALRLNHPGSVDPGFRCQLILPQMRSEYLAPVMQGSWASSEINFAVANGSAVVKPTVATARTKSPLPVLREAVTKPPAALKKGPPPQSGHVYSQRRSPQPPQKPHQDDRKFHRAGILCAGLLPPNPEERSR